MAATNDNDADDQETQEDAGQPQPEEGALQRGSKGWSKTHEAGYQAAMRELGNNGAPRQSGAATVPAARPAVTLPKPAPTFGGGAAALPRPAAAPGQVGGVTDNVRTNFLGQPASTAGQFSRNTPAGMDFNAGTGEYVSKSAPSLINGRPAADVLAEGAAKTGVRPVYSGSGLNGLPRAPQPVGPTPAVGGTQAVIAPPQRTQVAMLPRKPRGGMVQPNDSY